MPGQSRVRLRRWILEPDGKRRVKIRHEPPHAVRGIAVRIYRHDRDPVPILLGESIFDVWQLQTADRSKGGEVGQQRDLASSLRRRPFAAVEERDLRFGQLSADAQTFLVSHKEARAHRLKGVIRPDVEDGLLCHVFGRFVGEIEFPRPMSFLMRTMRFVPNALYDRMMVRAVNRTLDASDFKR